MHDLLKKKKKKSLRKPKPPAKLKQCPMENCWETIRIEKHLCLACTSWWYRISIKSAEELSFYMKRMGRFSGRFGHIRGRKGRP